MTHKSEDYKISAVKYYLKNKDNIRKTCKIFDCKKSTLQRWIFSIFHFENTINIMPYYRHLQENANMHDKTYISISHPLYNSKYQCNNSLYRSL